MKKLMFLFLLLFTANSLAATAVLRQGTYLDQYAIDDPGNASGFDNLRIIFSHQLSEVLIQTSGVDFTTRKANLLCWNDPDVLECPDDDLGGGVLRQPEIVFLNDIMLAGGVTLGANLADLREKEIYLGFIWEYTLYKVFQDAVAEMDIELLNDLQKRRALKYVMYGNGIDITTAQALANNWITNGIHPKYNELGLATVPLQYRRPLILFGEVGWFE